MDSHSVLQQGYLLVRVVVNEKESMIEKIPVPEAFVLSLPHCN